MRTTFSETSVSREARSRASVLDLAGAWDRLALAAIVVVGAALRFLNLSGLGYVNHYYAAATESMLQSWHNFFFVAAEPGGAVSVDKPPVGLWIEAVSARIFGINSFGLLLPEIVAGLLSVVIVYHLVRRSFGIIAGLVAALALAITPVVVATDRNNTIDSILILTLLLAAWAFIVATERASFRHLLLGAAIVGVGFNIKMLEAFLPLPAFYALYFFGARQGIWRKLGGLAVASMLLVVISMSWATVVDLTPADQRPYIGSSGDNSEWSLAIGYNGTERLLGMGGRGGLLGSLFGNGQGRGFPNGGQAGSQFPGGFGQVGPRGGLQPQNRGGPGGFAPQGQAMPGGFAGGAAAGISETGRPGALRLFTAPLSKEASWLLPFALFGALLLVFRARPRWPIAPKHQALVLWGGWLVFGAVFFSVAGFFHEYYLSMIGAPVAALTGITVSEVWAVRTRRRWFAVVLLALSAGASLLVQIPTMRAFTVSLPWLPLVFALLGVGAVLVVGGSLMNRRAAAAVGFACVVGATMVSPGIWSVLTSLNPSANQSLPSAYSGQPSSVPNGGGLEVNQALLNFLEANTHGSKYLFAVPSSMQGSDYVLATGRPVLYLGGFMGQDEVVTPEQLSAMAASGELRFIYWNSSTDGTRGFRSQSSISSWVYANCAPVTGFDTVTRNAGAPGGTSASPAAMSASGGFGSMRISLFQCSAGTGK